VNEIASRMNPIEKAAHQVSESKKNIPTYLSMYVPICGKTNDGAFSLLSVESMLFSGVNLGTIVAISIF
jgi:hypothetical protein